MSDLIDRQAAIEVEVTTTNLKKKWKRPQSLQNRR